MRLETYRLKRFELHRSLKRSWLASRAEFQRDMSAANRAAMTQARKAYQTSLYEVWRVEPCRQRPLYRLKLAAFIALTAEMLAKGM